MIWLQQNFKTSPDFQIVLVHSFGGAVRAIFFLSNFSCLDSFLMQNELACLKANPKANLYPSFLAKKLNVWLLLRKGS